MKEVKKIAEGKNFSAVDFGKLNELGDYVLSLGDIKIPGKVFGGQALGTKGSEFSFQIYAPGQEGGFYHTHKAHEELYFVLSGKGEYQVDGVNIPLQEAQCGARLTSANAPFTTTARSRWWCSASSIVRRLSPRTMPPMALS